MRSYRLCVALALRSCPAGLPRRPIRRNPCAWSFPGRPADRTTSSGASSRRNSGETSGQQFIVDNRGGAAGTIGSDLVAKSPPDGYTFMVHSATHVANPHLYKKLPYDTLKDFVGIAPVSAQIGILIVHPSMPVKTVKDLIALAKAKPGQIVYGSSGNGSFVHLTMALLNATTEHEDDPRALQRRRARGDRDRVRRSAGDDRHDRRRHAADRGKARASDRRQLGLSRRRLSPTCRRSRSPACRVTSSPPGSALSGRPACRSRSSTS